jgi:hypothetical protein
MFVTISSSVTLCSITVLYHAIVCLMLNIVLFQEACLPNADSCGCSRLINHIKGKNGFCVCSMHCFADSREQNS